MTLDDIIAEVDAEETTERARIEALLLPYRDNQDAANLYGKTAGELGRQIKEWLQLHPDEVLTDGEHGLIAKLQERKLPGKRYDLGAIIENNPALFAQLVEHRCLEINVKALEAAGPNVGGVEKYAYPQEKTTALIVTRAD